MTKTKFQICEEKGRMIVEKLLHSNNNILKWEWQEQMCHFDLLYTGTSHCYVAEIKYRADYASTASTITNTGLMLEKSKYNALIEKAKDGYIALYLMLFNDGLCAIYNVDASKQLHWQKKTLPRYTAENAGTREKIITYIPICECKKIRYNAND